MVVIQDHIIWIKGKVYGRECVLVGGGSVARMQAGRLQKSQLYVCLEFPTDLHSQSLLTPSAC